MSLLLVLVLAQDPPRPVLPDPFAADPYRQDIVYRGEVARLLPLLDLEETRDSAYLELHDLLKRFPGAPLLHYERGCFFSRNRKWDQAVREWEEALFADDGRTVVSVRTLEGLAAAEGSRGRREPALKALERLTAALPLSYVVHNRLAEAYSAAGRADKARASWERSVALHPGQAEVEKRLGRGVPRPKPAAVEWPALLKRLRFSIVMLKSEDRRSTGFVTLAKGWILSCAHGLERDATEVEIIYFGGAKPAELRGRVHFRDDKRDLALIHCPDLPGEAIVLPIVSGEGGQPGEKVFTVGNPGLGKEVLELTPSEGMLANARRELDDEVYLQASMNVNPGNSGGPMLNRHGEVLGVVVRKSYLDGVCFAVPASGIAEALASPSTLHAPPVPKAETPAK